MPLSRVIGMVRDGIAISLITRGGMDAGAPSGGGGGMAHNLVQLRFGSEEMAELYHSSLSLALADPRACLSQLLRLG